jgi:magnesium transporter
MLSAILMGAFETQLSANLVVAYFIPGIVYLADAVGTQTEALIIRGLSVGVSVRQVAWRESVTGLVVGAAIAALFIPTTALLWGDTRLAVAVGIALLGACSVGTVVALVLPALLARAGADFAFGSGPLATVVQDLLSIVLYFVVVVTMVG